jgi:hypothetical protein
MSIKLDHNTGIGTMTAELISHQGDEITVQFTVKLTGSMLADEESLQQTLNEAGCIAMKPMLKQFDTNGEPIRIGDVKYYQKAFAPQDYETPYGQVRVTRHAYQHRGGGRGIVPLELNARMVLNSTPRYAKIVSGKYTRFGAEAICEDLLECNGRSLSKNYAKKLSDYVGTIAQHYETEWEYDLPEFDTPVSSIVLGLDGTCMLMHKDGWREAMCGTISFYDSDGQRIHTIYCAATPEYGKDKFKTRFTREIQRVKASFPDVLYIGLADGAKDNWSFLEPFCDRTLLDFYHAREYITKAASAIFGDSKQRLDQKNQWIDLWSSKLKHKHGAAARFIAESETQSILLSGGNKESRQEELRKVITYYSNNKNSGRMKYAYHTKNNLPIGSGVTEAACKTLIKQRMCLSGSRWKNDGASCVLALRTLKLTKGRWEQFWSYTMRHGATVS